MATRTISATLLRIGAVTAALGFAALAVPGMANAHGGGLNAEGCHNERKTGGNHCHRAPAIPEREAPGAAAAATAASAARPTCYTGPRGGRYTITASGRKNYKGC